MTRKMVVFIKQIEEPDLWNVKEFEYFRDWFRMIDLKASHTKDMSDICA
jgi:hypothetical protein